MADGTSEERKQLLAERDELVNREWLAGIENDIIAEINRKKAIAVLQKASRDTVTNRITAKSAEIAESLVTKRASGLVRQGSEPAECGWVGNRATPGTYGAGHAALPCQPNQQAHSGCWGGAERG